MRVSSHIRSRLINLLLIKTPAPVNQEGLFPRSRHHNPPGAPRSFSPPARLFRALSRSFALHRLVMGGSSLDIGAHAPGYVAGLLLRHFAEPPGRDAGYEATGRELSSLGHHGTGCQDRTLPYSGSVEDRGVHPDETSIPHLAPVYDRFMTDHAPLAHHRRVSRVSMQNATVLNVRARPYPDEFRVAPQHGPIPDTGLLSQMHRPDDVGPRRDEGGGSDLRPLVPERKQDSTVQ